MQKTTSDRVTLNNNPSFEINNLNKDDNIGFLGSDKAKSSNLLSVAYNQNEMSNFHSVKLDKNKVNLLMNNNT